MKVLFVILGALGLFMAVSGVAALVVFEAPRYFVVYLVKRIFYGPGGRFEEQPLTLWELQRFFGPLGGGHKSVRDVLYQKLLIRDHRTLTFYLRLGPLVGSNAPDPSFYFFDVRKMDSWYLVKPPSLSNGAIASLLLSRKRSYDAKGAEPFVAEGDLILVDSKKPGWYWAAARKEIRKVQEELRVALAEQEAHEKQKELERKLKAAQVSQEVYQMYKEMERH